MAAKKSDPLASLTLPEDDWSPPKVDDYGRELDEHGLPTNPIQRAIVLDGKEDPGGIVDKDAADALNMAGTAADQEAVATYRLQRDWGDQAPAVAEAVAAASQSSQPEGENAQTAADMTDTPKGE